VVNKSLSSDFVSTESKQISKYVMLSVRELLLVEVGLEFVFKFLEVCSIKYVSKLLQVVLTHLLCKFSIRKWNLTFTNLFCSGQARI